MYVSSEQLGVIAQFSCGRCSIQAVVHPGLDPKVSSDQYGYSISRVRSTTVYITAQNIGFSDWATVVEKCSF